MDRIVSPNHYGIPPKAHRKFHQNRWNRLGGVYSQTHAQKKYIYIKISLQFHSKLFKLHELAAAPNADTKSKYVIFDTAIVTQSELLKVKHSKMLYSILRS